MALLHTWAGLVFGWLLFLVLLTGSIAVFADEITYWLTPEIPAHHRLDPARSLKMGEDYLRAHGPDSRLWRVTLPTAREPALDVSWRDQAGKTQTRRLDPTTGAEIQRKTEGGTFYLELHEGLHISRDRSLVGFWIVCVLGIGMMVACISGIVIHKRIFKDLFLYRPKASTQRSVLDLHNVFGVLALPFHLMMAFTGIFLLYWLFIPSAAPMLYPGANPEFRRDANGQTYRYLGKGVEPGPPAELRPLQFYVDKAEAIVGKGKTAYVYIRDPGRHNAVIEIHRERTDRVEQQVDQIALGPSGNIIRERVMARMSPTFRFQSFVAAWHWVEWGGNPVRWLYFLAGMMSAAVAAMGLVLFVAKRKGRGPGRPWLRWVEAANVAAVAGACVGSVAYLWAERLIPVETAGREMLPVNVFFYVWLASAVHAGLRPPRAAWIEQLSLAALLCLGAPLLQGRALQHLAAADWVRVCVDATLVGAGLTLAAIAWSLRQPGLAPAKA
jgi:uncharacterized iron-regulated membrane protein